MIISPSESVVKIASGKMYLTARSSVLYRMKLAVSFFVFEFFNVGILLKLRIV